MWPTWTRPAMPTTPPIDVLAIAAHRDDVEQTCGGTLLRMCSLQLRTAILDLTQGEAGTRGSAVERAREAEEAARILGWPGGKRSTSRTAGWKTPGRTVSRLFASYANCGRG